MRRAILTQGRSRAGRELATSCGVIELDSTTSIRASKSPELFVFLPSSFRPFSPPIALLLYHLASMVAFNSEIMNISMQLFSYSALEQNSSSDNISRDREIPSTLNADIVSMQAPNGYWETS